MNRTVIRSSARDIIYKVYMRCLSECEAGQCLSDLNDVYQRTAEITDDVGVKPSNKGDRATSLASPTQMGDVRLSYRSCSRSRITADRDRSRSRAGGSSVEVKKTKNKRELEDNSSSQSWESSCTDSTIDLTSDATTPDNRQRCRKKVKKKTSGSDNTGSGNTTEREVGNSLAELGKEVKAIQKASNKQVRRSPSPVDVMETDSVPPPPSDVAPGRQPSPPPQPFTPPSEKEELIREMMLRIGGLINARFEGLEGRLLPAPNLRPPLAADKKKAAAKAAKEAPAEAAPKPVPGKGKKAGKKAAPMPTQAMEVPTPKVVTKSAKSPNAAEATASTSTPQTAEAWNVVVSRKAKAKKAKAAAQAAEAAADASKKAKANKRRPRKKRSLKAPRNPAVVLSISPDAAASLSYAQVMAKAREGINWSDLGVEGLKLRGTATGARLMELPKVTSPEKADQLAARLKEVLPPEVTVSRPVKCAEVRISGLDDSVTEADVRAAIARVGGCPEDAVRVGGLRFNPYTLGSIWAKCPIPAAKAIGSNKLLIGCTSARVTLLDPRPMRWAPQGPRARYATEAASASAAGRRDARPGNAPPTPTARSARNSGHRLAM
ncbi:hypothetical protein ACJJTC_008629 [Scirpophaga incertulas]